MTTDAPRFLRDRFTWLAYWMLAYYAYCMALLGPAMPFVRAELNLDYTTTALHLSAFAIGMTAAGLTSDRAAALVTRPRAFWGGGLGMAVGAFLLLVGGSVVLTLGGALLMGWLGSYLLVMIQATLADRHGDLRRVALIESNVLAMLFAGIAPLMVGVGESIGIGWRFGFAAGIALFIALTAVFRGVRLPAAVRVTGAHDEETAPLPRLFWLYWLVAFFSVAVEWSIIFWGADFLERVVRLDRVLAATLMSVFLLAMTFGRLVGSRLTRRYNNRPLLLVSILLVAISFPVFWLANIPILNIIGLFGAGLGVANLYPLTLGITTSIAPGQSNKASGRTSFASGLAILILPQLLGSAADQIGIQTSVGFIAGMIGAALVFIIVANRAAKRMAS